MIARGAFTGLLLATAGCVTAGGDGNAEAPPPATIDGPENCDAGAASALIGRPATSELAAEALRLTGARSVRWIQPGQAVTMDYRAGRLNIHLDSKNLTERFTCG